MTKLGDINMKLAYAALGLLALLFVLGNASANAPIAMGGACSQAVAPNIVGGIDLASHIAIVRATPTTGQVCSSGTSILDVNAGSSVTLVCTELTNTGDLGATTTITVKGVSDNTGYGSTAVTPIWTWTPTAPCPAVGTTTTSSTRFCTVDGTSGAAPYYGVVRIQVHAIRIVAAVTIYDVNSETNPGNPSAVPYVGIYRCNPKPTVLDDGTSPQNPWVGGDFINARVAVDSTAYNGGADGTDRRQCGSSVVHDFTGRTFSTSTLTLTTEIKGTPHEYESGCTFVHQAILSTKSSIALYSTTDYAIWNQASPISGIVFSDSVTASFTGNVLNRILTPFGTCAVSVSGTSTTVVNRFQTAHITGCGPWKNARSETLGDGQTTRGWIVRPTLWHDSSDFGTSDVTIVGAGTLTTDNLATTTATVTIPDPLDYHQTVELFANINGFSRAATELTNWGNTTVLLDVSNLYTFGTCGPSGCQNGILNSKTDNGANVTAFTISADVEHVRAETLKDASGNLLSGIPVTCFRTQPSLLTETPVAVGNTNGAGITPDATFTVVSPAGTWKLECDVTSNGNTAQYKISFFFTSAFTADKYSPTAWNLSLDSNLSRLRVNITMRFGFYDTSTDSVGCAFPDDVVKLTVFSFNQTSLLYDIKEQSRVVMNPTVAADLTLGCAWSYNFTMPIANLSKGAFAYTTFNFTGSPFLSGEGYSLQNFTLANITAIGNYTGTFAGTFIGNVTDLSAVPQTISVPAVFIGGIVLLVIASFATRNPIAGILCTIVALAGWGLTLNNQSYFDASTFKLVLIAWIAATALMAFRTFTTWQRKSSDAID